MNRPKKIASALLLMIILPLAPFAFASDRDDDEPGRGHEYGEHRRDHHRHHGHHGHHRHHYRHYYHHHDRHHHGYHGGYYDGDRRWHDNRASVTVPFPPLPPFPPIILKPHH